MTGEIDIEARLSNEVFIECDLLAESPAVKGIDCLSAKQQPAKVSRAVVQSDGSILFEDPNVRSGESHARMATDFAGSLAFWGSKKSIPLTVEAQIGTFENGSTVPPMHILESSGSEGTTMVFHPGARTVQSMLRWAMFDFDADRNGILSANELDTAYGAANKYVHPYFAGALQFANKNISAFAGLSRDGDDGKAGITNNDIDQISNYDSYFTKQTWLTKNPNSWWYFLWNPSVKTEYSKLFEQMNQRF